MRLQKREIKEQLRSIIIGLYWNWPKDVLTERDNILGEVRDVEHLSSDRFGHSLDALSLRMQSLSSNEMSRSHILYMHLQHRSTGTISFKAEANMMTTTFAK